MMLLQEQRWRVCRQESSDAVNSQQNERTTVLRHFNFCPVLAFRGIGSPACEWEAEFAGF